MQMQHHSSLLLFSPHKLHQNMGHALEMPYMPEWNGADIQFPSMMLSHL